MFLLKYSLYVIPKKVNYIYLRSKGFAIKQNELPTDIRNAAIFNAQSNKLVVAST